MNIEELLQGPWVWLIVLGFILLIISLILSLTGKKKRGTDAAPQPTSSDYSMPQNYQSEESRNRPSVEPAISMGSGNTFDTTPVTPEPSMESPLASAPEEVPTYTATPVSVMPPVEEEVKVDPLPIPPKEVNMDMNPTMEQAPQDANVQDINFAKPASMEPKICPNCGAQLDSNATVCFLCGKTL